MGGVMAVDRGAPGVCEQGAVLMVVGLTGVIWQVGCCWWETVRWSSLRGGSRVAGGTVYGLVCGFGPRLRLTPLSLL